MIALLEISVLSVTVEALSVEVNIVFAVIVEPVAVKKTKKLLLRDPV